MKQSISEKAIDATNELNKAALVLARKASRKVCAYIFGKQRPSLSKPKKVYFLSLPTK